MKNILLIVAFIFLSSASVFADITAEIIDVSQDQKNYSIIVKTQYFLDGVEVKSNYPPENGKYYWVTRYNIDRFAGMTDQQVKNYILNEISQFGKVLISRSYFEKANLNFLQSKASLLIGQKETISTADIQVDKNLDGVIDTVWHVKSDGTKTEEANVTP
jgi:hypothetical protein